MPDWDVSLVTSMEDLFSDKYDFNQDISRWETSNVKSMRQMFSQAQSFTASDLADWNVGKVKDMNGMFQWVGKYLQQPGPVEVERRRGD